VKRDPAEAMKWCQKSLEIERFYLPLQILGEIYASGNGVPKDDGEAARYFKEAAALENWESEIAYARCLAEGRGVARNLTEAAAWYGKAAKQGHPEALFEQAMVLSKMDDDEARQLASEFIEQLVKMENAGAMREKALRLVRDPTEAVVLLRKAAELGDRPAMTSLGDCYANGTGVTRDPAAAVAWYHKAAEKGDPAGQLAYSNCLRSGTGVERNETEAGKWLGKAVGRNYGPAQVRMAQLLLSGKPPNAEEAAQWFKKAAEQEDVEGQYELGRCYQNGTGVEKDDWEAAAWYEKSARHGSMNGRVAYGKCLLEGIGVSPSKTLAKYWFQRAAQQGSKEAKDLIPE
jgi:TPR repeat protein